MVEPTKRYKVIPFPASRQLIVDAGRLGSRRHLIHGLLEIEFVGDENAAADLLSSLVSSGLRIASFNETVSDLEEIFLQLTKGEVA